MILPDLPQRHLCEMLPFIATGMTEDTLLLVKQPKNKVTKNVVTGTHCSALF